MRLNVVNYRTLLRKKQITDEYVQKAIGLSERTYSWIMENGFIECETIERIAEVMGCRPGEIMSSDYEGYSENVIEWVKDEKCATLSLSQRRTITRVKELAKKFPDKCQILRENKDGSVYAHIPTDWIRINPNLELTDKQKQKRADIMRKNRLKTD